MWTHKEATGTHTQRKGHMSSQREGGHRQAKEIRLGRKQICHHLVLGFGVFRNYEKINFFCLSHPVDGLLSWQPEQTNTCHPKVGSGWPGPRIQALGPLALRTMVPTTVLWPTAAGLLTHLWLRVLTEHLHFGLWRFSRNGFRFSPKIDSLP